MQNQHQQLAQQLQQFTQSFMPDLLFLTPPSDFLLSNSADNEDKDIKQIQALYEAIQTTHPEAQHSYWLSRTWTLLTWQPLYISFVSIYMLKHLPELEHFYQRRQGHSVLGICLSSEQFHFDSLPELINKAARQLGQTFNYYQQLLDKLYRCRPQFTQRLIQDALYTVLVQLKAHSPSPLPAVFIKQQAELWLQAFALPKLNKRFFYIDSELDEVYHQRESCCFVHQTAQGDYCQNCPKLNK